MLFFQKETFFVDHIGFMCKVCFILVENSNISPPLDEMTHPLSHTLTIQLKICNNHQPSPEKLTARPLAEQCTHLPSAAVTCQWPVHLPTARSLANCVSTCLWHIFSPKSIIIEHKNVILSVCYPRINYFCELIIDAISNNY